MASEFGFVAPTGIVCANPTKIALIREFECETAAGCYPGRLTKTGSTMSEAVTNDTSDNSACLGWIGYEQASMDDMPDTIDTVWTVNKSMPVLNGPGMVIRAGLCGQANNSVTIGHKLVSASYYGGLDKFRSNAVTATYSYAHKNPVALALETVDASGLPRTTVTTIWVMSLI